MTPVAVVRDDDTSVVARHSMDAASGPVEHPAPAADAASAPNHDLLQSLRAQVAQVESQPLAQPSIMPLGLNRPAAPHPSPTPAEPASTDAPQEPDDPGTPDEPPILRVISDDGERIWSTDDDEELRDGAEMGLSETELADHPDIPLADVRGRAMTLGLDLDS